MLQTNTFGAGEEQVCTNENASVLEVNTLKMCVQTLAPPPTHTQPATSIFQTKLVSK